MKKIHLLVLALFACIAGWAEDNNKFYFTDAVIKPGETANIELCMRNEATDLSCLEAEIQLPEGLSVVKDAEGNPQATLYRNRIADHEILANVLADGKLKLLVSSVSGQALDNVEGPLLSFCVRADDTAPVGECAVETVGESLLVNASAEAFYSVGVKGIVQITDDATSIESLQEQSRNGLIYNTSGQRLNKKQKGINIINGRKELHK
ncbi:MAG: hypothetical protein J6Q60_02205 [Bacteroidaceae bacterium]|nr:hypothetical protein [Bacteroidaceae bacterium]